MEEQINQLQDKINELMNWKIEKERQQISFPLDKISQDILSPSLGSIAVGGLYLSTSGTNPISSLGYGTWTIVGTGNVLEGINTGTGGTTGTILATAGATNVKTTYKVYFWLRQA